MAKKLPTGFSFWTRVMQIAWLEQNGYEHIAESMRKESE